MSPTRWRRAFSFRICVNCGLTVVAVVSSVVGCGYYLSANGRPGSLAAKRPLTEVEPAHGLAVALNTAGLDATALAAAGVSPASVAGVIESVRGHLAEHSFTAAAQTRASYTAELHRLIDLVQRRTATESDLQSLASARAAAAAAESSYQAAVADIFAAGTAELTATQRNALGRLRANRERAVPVKYLAAERTESDWVSLRDAVSALTIASRNNQSPPAAAQAVVAAANAAAADAEAGLALLPQIKSVWTSSVNAP
jgi:hypothetical protein